MGPDRSAGEHQLHLSVLPMTAAAPGWYGKLGALGDFASRRLAPEVEQACDRWLARMQADSQLLLGDRWLPAYLRAPLWRTAWAPGAFDEQWWFGALMPSCDSVGRYFPLLVLQQRRQAPQDRIALDHLELWWQSLAQVMLHTLSEGAQLQEFELGLAELPPWPTVRAFRAETPAGWSGTGEGAMTELLAWPGGTGLSQGLGMLCAQRLIASLGGRSVWWPLSLDSGAQGVHLMPGLPDGAGFARLMGEV